MKYLTESADRVFNVVKEDEVSHVTQKDSGIKVVTPSGYFLGTTTPMYSKIPEVNE